MRFADDPVKEDYSLRYTPSAFRKWRPWRLWITAVARTPGAVPRWSGAGDELAATAATVAAYQHTLDTH